MESISAINLRPASAADLPFIEEMLFEAFFWRAAATAAAAGRIQAYA